ncbi:MAG: hypothetical protein HYX73_08790 [Acidobacteria bacterium]|nr:hypothetical protein [Acidobacteriota bacterium]
MAWYPPRSHRKLGLDKQCNIDYSTHMGALNIRDFPSDLLQKLKIRAAMEGTTVKSLVIGVLEQEVKGIEGPKSTRGKKTRKK